MRSICLENIEDFPSHIRLHLANGCKEQTIFPPSYRKASVLMPLVLDDGEWKVLFTRRSDTVQDHKGQVSFPGGAAEPTDHGPEETALRELEEETGILSAEIEILGVLPEMSTITGFLVTPVVGRLPWPAAMSPNTEEVARVFTIPLCWLAEASNRQEQLYRLSDGSEHPVIFFQEYDGELVWGVTARILVNFLELVGLPGKRQ